MEDISEQQIYKIIIIGDGNVGKSSIMLRFIKNSFDDSINSTIGVDFSSQKIKVKGNNVKINIWDTAGQERYNSITSNYYKNVDAALIVFNLNNKLTFDNIKKIWINNIIQQCGNIPFIFIGNKLDIEEREVMYTEGIKLAKEYNTSYYELSAKKEESHVTIENIFKKLVEKVYYINYNKYIEDKEHIDDKEHINDKEHTIIEIISSQVKEDTVNMCKC